MAPCCIWTHLDHPAMEATALLHTCAAGRLPPHRYWCGLDAGFCRSGALLCPPHAASAARGVPQFEELPRSAAAAAARGVGAGAVSSAPPLHRPPQPTSCPAGSLHVTVHKVPGLYRKQPCIMSLG